MAKLNTDPEIRIVWVQMKVTREVPLEAIEIDQEESDAIQGKVLAVAVPIEEAAVEDISALDDWSEDQQLAIGTYLNGGPKIIYEEPLKNGHSRRNCGRSQNAATP